MLHQLSSSHFGQSVVVQSVVTGTVCRLVHPAAADFPAWSSYGGDALCTGIGLSVYPPDADRAGYTYWHRDHPQTEMWPHPKHRVLNMFVHLFDCDDSGGPTAIVPGSHRLRHGPMEVLRRSFQSSLTLDAELPPTAMPNLLPLAGKAGTAYIFDASTWHTPMPNTSDQPRRCFRMGWRSSAGPLLADCRDRSHADAHSTCKLSRQSGCVLCVCMCVWWGGMCCGGGGDGGMRVCVCVAEQHNK